MTARPGAYSQMRIPDLAAGACVGMDPHLFDTELHREPTSAAKRACRRCPVRADCRDWATREGEVGMVWGGQARPGRWTATDPHLRTAVLERAGRGWSTARIADDLDVPRTVVSALRGGRHRERAVRGHPGPR